MVEEARRQRKHITLFSYEDAQEEIARNSGLDFSNGNIWLTCIFDIWLFISLAVVIMLLSVSI